MVDVTARRASGTWARAHGVSLVPATPEVIRSDPGLMRALADGIKRGIDPEIELPGTVDWYLVREQRVTIGAVAVRRDYPDAGAATLVAVAIHPEHRGRASGTKAVIAAERRLQREGFAPVLVRVPRTNGRGLYFMMRCGYTPVARRPEDAGNTTWFARVAPD
jgi:GNAT superfamily N-acetyltransferase